MDKFSDLLLFADFSQQYSAEFELGYRFIIYVIGSPRRTPTTSYITSQYQIPLYILAESSSSTTEKYKLLIHYVPFEYIVRISIGDEILPMGNIRYLGSLSDFKYTKDKNEGFLTKKAVSISKETIKNPIICTLSELITNYGLFNKIPQDLLDSNAKDEWFYLFKTDEGSLVISAVEILRHFYLASPGPSLTNHILDPKGVQNLSRGITTDRMTRKGKKYPYFKIDIHPFSQMVDINKIFFFSCSRRNKQYFSSIAHHFLKTHKLNALIPTLRTLHLSVDIYKQGDYFLITKIHESSIASHMQDWIVDYTHPQSRPHVIKQKVKPPQIVQRADPSNVVSHVQYTNKKIKPKKISDKSQFFGEGKLENPKFPLGPTFKHLPNEEERTVTESNKISKDLGDRDIGLSGRGLNKDGPIAVETYTKKDKSQKKKDEAEEGEEIQSKQTLYDEEISTKIIEKIAQEFIAQGCSAHIQYKSVKRPYISQKIVYKSIKYYVEILIQKEELQFVYVDILAKQYTATSAIYNDKKEVLLIKRDKQFKDYYIKNLIYDQLVEGNHKWGAKSPYKKLFTYSMIKHRQDLKSFVESILEIMSR
ncbi:MAG: hypothetical protein H6Q35_1348 [Proteobacteria bacterium]|nr:hypothetical protein [Pseudomonadota bacterium]